MSDRLLRRTSTGLTLAGLGIAGYLTYVHYAGLQPVCGISHCSWCVSSAIVFTLLAAVGTVRAVRAARALDRPVPQAV
jgi:hypothetical protein